MVPMSSIRFVWLSVVAAALLLATAPARAGAIEANACTALPPGGVMVDSRDAVPLSFRAELEAKFEGWNRFEASQGMAPDVGVYWLAASGSPTTAPSGPRRFMFGGHVKNRWFLWYEYRDDSRTFHMVVADVDPKDGARLIAHAIASNQSDLCATTRNLMADPNTPGPGADNNPFW